MHFSKDDMFGQMPQLIPHSRVDDEPASSNSSHHGEYGGDGGYSGGGGGGSGENSDFEEKVQEPLNLSLAGADNW